MKKILAVLLFVGGFTMSAQDAELDAFRELYNSEKKTVMAEFLELDATKTATFNELYDAYAMEHKEIANSRMSVLEMYVDNYANLSDEKADELVKETFALRAKTDKLQKKYYKKMKKAFGAKTASQFVQFERYVQTSIDEGIQEALPIIGEE